MAFLAFRFPRRRPDVVDKVEVWTSGPFGSGLCGGILWGRQCRVLVMHDALSSGRAAFEVFVIHRYCEAADWRIGPARCRR